MRRRRIAALILAIMAITLVVGHMCNAAGKAGHVDQLQGIARIVYADSILGFAAATAITVHVTGVADRDPATHAWRYTYTLKNDAASTNVIQAFALTPVLGPPLSVSSPAHWMGARGYEGDTSAIVWDVVDLQNPPANWDSLSPYPSIYALQPGDSAVFQFAHILAPAMTTYYVQGFFYPDTSAESNGPINPSIFQSSVTGSVVAPGSTVGVGEMKGGGRIELRSPIPNPASGQVAITFYLPVKAAVRVGIYDVAGRRIRTLAEGAFGPGYHSLDWEGREEGGGRAKPGMYFYRLFVDGKPAGEKRVAIIR